MKTNICFDILFPQVDLDAFMPKANKCPNTHHAHLFTDNEVIEIRIYFKSETHFNQKFNKWFLGVKWKEFGTKFEVQNIESSNNELLEIDFAECKFLGLKEDVNFTEGQYHYIKIFIDWVKLYWKPQSNTTNTAEFYLNDAGFDIIKDFYGLLFFEDDKFIIPRNKEFYQLINSKFRPEFLFKKSQNINSNKIIIEKIPKLYFLYEDDISEKDAIKFIEMVCLMSSFYSHSPIDYSFARIHLNNETIKIKKIFSTQIKKDFSPWIFSEGLDTIFKQNWQDLTLKNYDKLKRAIEKLNQSMIVDGSSRFLLRYNIIEICKEGNKNIGETFNFTLEGEKLKQKWEEVLDLLIEIVNDDEKEDFKKKWNAARESELKYKVMLGPLKQFLRVNDIDINKFPHEINIERIKKIRDNLTHRSDSNLSPDELDKANNLLYQISVCLIANLMGLSSSIFDENLYKIGLNESS